MKKTLKIFLSLILATVTALGMFTLPASSFHNDEITSSYAMLMINLDTRTVVFSQRADKVWNASYMSELMTFLVMCDRVEDPQSITVKVDEDFIDDLDHSDGCLEKYLGDKLTLKDLAAIMMLTSGSDAAFLIADYIGEGDVDAFVDMMNERAAKIGCKKTAFISPGYSESKEQYSTCTDFSRIYNRIMNLDLYREIMESPTYIPEKYGDDDDYAVTTENSIMNPRSPYYFRYVTGGKFSNDPVSGANIIVTTDYQDIDYMFIAIRGKNEAEENVFADARRMTTWAYLNLSDRKVVDTGISVDTSLAVSNWGEYPIDLYADNSAYKTLPNEYEQNKFDVKMIVDDHLKLPLFMGEGVGEAEILYDGEKLDKVTIVPGHDEGVSLLNDVGRFGGYALAKMFPLIPGKYQPTDEEDDLKEKPSEILETKPAPAEETEETEEPKESDEAEETKEPNESDETEETTAAEE